MQTGIVPQGTPPAMLVSYLDTGVSQQRHFLSGPSCGNPCTQVGDQIEDPGFWL